MFGMRRREFVSLLGGEVAWPLAARAQQPEPVRRIGVLMAQAADDPDGRARVAAFLQSLHELEWIEGRNVRLDYRWGGGDVDRIRRDAAELVASGRMSSWPAVAKSWGRCERLPGLCPLCSRRRLIRLAPALSPPCRGRVATPLVLPTSNTASAGSGSRY